MARSTVSPTLPLTILSPGTRIKSAVASLQERLKCSHQRPSQGARNLAEYVKAVRLVVHTCDKGPAELVLF